MQTPPPRKIVHVDMDAFYASVEQRDDPALRGRPVVVAWKGARSVVCAASYEARACGVRSAMPALKAERLCPQAVFVAPDFGRYREVSRAVRAILSRHSEQVEPLSLDEAYLDVTENRCGLPSATAVAQSIRQEIRERLQLTASAGVAPNKFLAKIASDWCKPDGLFVIRPAEAEAFLLPLPVQRLPGVGQVTARRLAERGVATVADLRQQDAAALEQAFGRFGRRLHELARGVDHSPVCGDRPTQSISCEDTLPQDLPRQDLEPLLRRMAGCCWQASRSEPRQARTVVLKLKTADFRIITRSHTPAEPPASLDALIRIALQCLARVDGPPTRRYRLLGVGLSHFIARGREPEQAGLFDPAPA